MVTAQRTVLGRVAAIDVGTNSLRLVVAEVNADRSFRILDDEKVSARLGRGLDQRGSLDPEVMEDAATMIGRLRAIAEGYGVQALRAVGTWAVREASNGPAFVELVRERAGVELEVISAEEEARLVFQGVRRAFDLGGTAVAVMDVGGGSAEVVLTSGEVIDRIYTLPLGAVGLTERFGSADADDGERFKRMRRTVRRTLRERVGEPPFVPHLLIGTGGTFSALAAISMHHGSRGRDEAVLPFNVGGYEMQRAEVRHILNQLRKMRLRERARVAGVSPERADIIVAGLCIVESALRHFSINRLRVSDQGVRAGLIHAMVDARWPAPDAGVVRGLDRMRGVRHFAAACRWEEPHAVHVAALAIQLFDQLAAEAGGEGQGAGASPGPGWAAPAARELLEAAALLHDVGYVVNYAGHHKHTFHLIVHSELPGFTRRGLELIANIARYHRGARPKDKHSNFARLTAAEQDLVRRLAGILRIAVGLDRSHTQEVKGVRLRRHDGAAQIEVDASGEPAVDLWAGRRTCGLFEEAFGLTVQFDWVPAEYPAPVRVAAARRRPVAAAKGAR